MAIGALHDDVAALRSGLHGVTHELESVARRLRDSTPEDVGPSACASAVTDAVRALANRLDALALQAADGSVAVTHHLDEPPTGDGR